MVNLVCFGIYFVMTILWTVLLLMGSKKYQSMVAPLESNKYILKSLYVVGFEVLEIIHYSYDSHLDQKRLSQAKIVYGEQYGEYYYRINMAEKVTYLMLGFAVSPLLGPLFGNVMLVFVGLFFTGIAYYYADSKITDVIDSRELSITKEFSDMLSKMALLINAGMITREAWEEIANTGNGVLYQEMRKAVQDMENGMSEIDAYIAFGNRCGVTYVKKFTSMLVQNLSKGNKELVTFLKGETVVSWEEKKHAVRRQGEAAANKLLIPLGMIMMGIFIMILVPIISKMGV